jgi:hypothetical protein
MQTSCCHFLFQIIIRGFADGVLLLLLQQPPQQEYLEANSILTRICLKEWV